MKHLSPLALGACLLLPAPARAATKIFFFGGSATSTAQLNRCFPSFVNVGYVSAPSDIGNVVREINAHPDQAYVVAGHSSGARYANWAVAGVTRVRIETVIDERTKKEKYVPVPVSRVKIVNPQRLTLVDLDGFAPRDVPKAIPRRICWNAIGGSRGNLKSRNFDAASTGNNCTEVRTFRGNHSCRTSWCMHFVFVNERVPASLDDGTWISRGYEGCSASPPWLQGLDSP